VQEAFSGTRRENGSFVTDGGRVLGLTLLGDDLYSAINEIYDYISEVNFQDMHYRTDIGKDAIKSEKGVN